VVLLLVNVFLLIVGTLMDITAALIILAPILAPLAINQGVHPLHFEFDVRESQHRLMTPRRRKPLHGYGYYRKSICGESPTMWPFVLVEVVSLLITYVPSSHVCPEIAGFYN